MRKRRGTKGREMRRTDDEGRELWGGEAGEEYGGGKGGEKRDEL